VVRGVLTVCRVCVELGTKFGVKMGEVNDWETFVV